MRYDGPMTAVTPTVSQRRPSTTRRLGYTIAIVVNGAILFVVHNLLAWGVPEWLTDDFGDVLPILTLSLLAAIMVNTVFLFYDEPWFTTACELVTLGLSMAVVVTTYRVFPFDFSAYAWDWDVMVRWVIILTIAAMSIALVVNAVKLVTIIVQSLPGVGSTT
jgi:hypothetical protein